MPELDEFHYHEMLDRLSVMMQVVNNNVQQHPVAKIDKELKEHISSAVDQLWLAYQKTGQLITEKFETNNSKQV